MSTFGGLLFTNKGRNLQAKAQTGVQLKFTKISLGDGELGTSTIPDLTELKRKVLDLPIERLRVLSDGRAEVGAILSNQTLTSGFYYRELGLFAEDPQEGEILYCYGNARSLAEYIPASGGADVIEKQIIIQTIIGNATNITAVIDSSLVYATVKDVNSYIENHSKESASITKAGHVLLNDNTNSSSTIQAGTANAVKKAKEEAIAFAQSFGLGGTGKKIEADYNEATNSGFFYAAPNLANAPKTGVSFVVLVDKGSAISQLAISHNNEIFVRSYTVSGWSTWVQSETTVGAQAKDDAVRAWVKSSGLADSAVSIPSSDANLITLTGFYVVDASTKNAPANGPHYGTLIHTQRWADATQLFISTSLTMIQVRRKVGGNWQAWTELETTSGAQAKADTIKTWAQGFGLGINAPKVSTDLNNEVSNGWVQVTASTLNIPTVGFLGVVRTDSRAVGRASQTAYNLDGGTVIRIYNRSLGSTGWGPWVRQIDESMKNQPNGFVGLDGNGFLPKTIVGENWVPVAEVIIPTPTLLIQLSNLSNYKRLKIVYEGEFSTTGSANSTSLHMTFNDISSIPTSYLAQFVDGTTVSRNTSSHIVIGSINTNNNPPKFTLEMELYHNTDSKNVIADCSFVYGGSNSSFRKTWASSMANNIPIDQLNSIELKQPSGDASLKGKVIVLGVPK